MKLMTHYSSTDVKAHPEIINWRENYLNDSLFYSFRSTEYNPGNYPSRLHYHDYYELVVFLEGDIQYICESSVCHPQYGDIVLIPPHKFHMSVIQADRTRYKRHVFYFYPDALTAFSADVLLQPFFHCPKNQYLFTLQQEKCQALHALLIRLDEVLQSNEDRDQALAKGLILEIFYLMGEAIIKKNSGKNHLPENVLQIQHYIDENFCDISSVSEIAEHFFYSREYVSRLFRRYFNTTVSDYLLQRRIARSQILIAENKPLSEICFQVGFGSLSSFINAFKNVTHQTPGQYRKQLSE